MTPPSNGNREKQIVSFLTKIPGRIDDFIGKHYYRYKWEQTITRNEVFSRLQ